MLALRGKYVSRLYVRFNCFGKPFSRLLILTEHSSPFGFPISIHVLRKIYDLVKWGAALIP